MNQSVVDPCVTDLSRINVEVGHDESFVEAIEREYIERGYTAVDVGCPIDGQVAVRYDGNMATWVTDHHHRLFDALGAKTLVVDESVAWIPHVTMLNADRDRLVVAIPDVNAIDIVDRPSDVDAVIVAIPGRLVGFDPDQPATPAQWVQLGEFLTVLFCHAVQRGEHLFVGPLLWERADRPSVTASAVPGDEIDLGYGFYVDSETDDDWDEVAPIAAYRRSALPVVGEELCDAIKSWGVSPINIGHLTVTDHRRLCRIPD